MKIGSIFRSAGVLLVLLGLLSLFTFSSIVAWLQPFAEANFSPDNALSNASEIRITLSVIYSTVTLMFLGGILIVIRKAGMRTFILRVMHINPQSEPERPPRFLAISSIVTILLAVTYVVHIFNPRMHPLYAEGGLFENLTAIALAVSSLLVRHR